MNAIVKIEEQNVNVVEYKSLPVLTTAQLAEFYGTEQNNVHVNFTRNSERFIEGKHYFKLDGEELKQFKNIPTQSKYVPKQAARLILWTEKGAARHAKIYEMVLFRDNWFEEDEIHTISEGKIKSMQHEITKRREIFKTCLT